MLFTSSLLSVRTKKKKRKPNGQLWCCQRTNGTSFEDIWKICKTSKSVYLFIDKSTFRSLYCIGRYNEQIETRGEIESKKRSKYERKKINVRSTELKKKKEGNKKKNLEQTMTTTRTRLNERSKQQPSKN